MDFTDQDYMIMEQITYFNKNVADAADVGDMKSLDQYETVGELFANFKEENLNKLAETGTICNKDGSTNHIQGDEWAAIIRHIQNDPDLSSLSIYDVTTTNEDKTDKMLHDDTKIDTLTLCETKEDGTYDFSMGYVCFRGTLDAKEWYDDALLLLTPDTPCNKAALEYVKENLSDFEKLSGVGHSKGGNKLLYLLAHLDNIEYALLMDSPGMISPFYDQEALREKVKSGSLKIFALSEDFVSPLLFSFAGDEVQFFKGNGLATFSERHSPNSFFKMSETNPGCFEYDEDGNIVMVSGDRNFEMKIAHQFTLFAATFLSDDVDIKTGKSERMQMADFVGCVLAILLGKEYTIDGVEYKSKPGEGELGVADYIATKPEMLTTFLALIAVYYDHYIKDPDSIDAFDVFGTIFKIWGMKKLGVLGQNILMVNSLLKLLGKGGILWQIVSNIIAMKDILDESTIEYIENNFSVKYDEIKNRPGMGKDLIDPMFPSDISPDNSNGDPNTGSSVIDDSYFPDPFFWDQNIYTDKAEVLFASADELKFDTQFFDMENEVCGTECMVTLADYWHKTADVTENNRKFNVGPVYQSLIDIQKSVMLTNQNVADSLQLG